MGRARGQNFTAPYNVGGSREPGGIVSIFTDFLLELYLYSLRNCERVERKEGMKEGGPDGKSKQTIGREKEVNIQMDDKRKNGDIAFSVP